MLKHAARCDVRVHRSESFKTVFSICCFLQDIMIHISKTGGSNWTTNMSNWSYDSLLSHDMIKQKWKIPTKHALARALSQMARPQSLEKTSVHFVHVCQTKHCCLNECSLVSLSGTVSVLVLPNIHCRECRLTSVSCENISCSYHVCPGGGSISPWKTVREHRNV